MWLLKGLKESQGERKDMTTASVTNASVAAPNGKQGESHPTAVPYGSYGKAAPAKHTERVAPAAKAAPKDRGPNVVSGRVTDTQGRPMEGVAVRAHCGMGTLFQAGITTTDKDGRYTLRFAGAGYGEFGATVIFAHKAGFAEKSRSQSGHYYGAVHVDSLDFVLVPAPNVDIELLDADGKPIAKKKICLMGERLPPACNVLQDRVTDSRGQIRFEEVPPTFACWFVVETAPRREVRTPSMTFARPEDYRVRLRFKRDAVTGLDLFEVLSVKNGKGEEVRNQVVADEPRAHSPLPSTSHTEPRASERAVAAALNWLYRHQDESGKWSLGAFDKQCKGTVCSGRGVILSDSEATGMALLVFLAAGQTHKSKGPYQQAVAKGIAWLIKQQDAAGDLSGKCSMPLHAHGIATVALCSAFAMTKDPELGAVAQKAIDYIERAQNKSTGGWRYEPQQDTSDTTEFGCQIMALKSAQCAGLKVTPSVLENAKKWLRTVAKGEHLGLYSYQPNQEVTPDFTAVGMLCSQYLGASRDDPAMLESMHYLLANQPDNKARHTHYWYYGTLAMHNLGGPEWETWNRNLRKLLIESQIKDGCAAGSWDPSSPTRDFYGERDGRLITTCFSVLTLEVYYRYLPLDQLELKKSGDQGGGAPQDHAATQPPPPSGAASPKPPKVAPLRELKSVYMSGWVPREQKRPIQFFAERPDRYWLSPGVWSNEKGFTVPAQSPLREFALALTLKLQPQWPTIATGTGRWCFPRRPANGSATILLA